MKRRFHTRPCDNAGSLPDAPRDRTWDVVDRLTGETVLSDCYTRREARDEARRLNQELGVVIVPSRRPGNGAGSAAKV